MSHKPTDTDASTLPAVQELPEVTIERDTPTTVPDIRVYSTAPAQPTPGIVLVWGSGDVITRPESH